MWTEIFSGFAAFLLLLVGIIYIHRKRSHQLFISLGIPGPTPHWLYGNLFQMKSTPLYELVPQWTQKYGKIWGYYEGPTPIIVTSDVELLQEVFVKQFRNFYGRKLFPIQDDPDTSKNVSLFTARGARWKRLRTTMNPSFTESRMRQMFPLVDHCIQRMLLSVEEAVKESGGNDDVDLYKYFQLLTLDTICECAFGVELNTQSNPDNIVIEKLRVFFNEDRSGLPIMIMGILFPELRSYLGSLMNLIRPKSSPITTLTELVKDVVKKRREAIQTEGASVRVDLLQLLLDAEVCPVAAESGVTPTNTIDQDANDGDLLETSSAQCPVAHHASSNGMNGSNSHPQVHQKTKRLTQEEVVAQALLFLFAGYETSSTALAYCVYELVQSPRVLDRLVDEIDSAMQDLPDEDKAMGSVTFYKAICRLPYLEAVLWETLRFHPFVNIVINRRVMSSSVQWGQYALPEGAIVAPDAYTVHFNEDLWGPIDVHKFDPDRHLKLKENGKYEFTQPDHAMAMLGFGAGPKNCIGQRFALMEMRACLVRFLVKFSIQKGAKTPEKMPLRMAGTVAPRDGVWLKVQVRGGQDSAMGAR